MNKLFHYTSIQTLALILKSRKLRFKRLDLVDDLEEACYVNPQSLCTHFFISCWTLDAKESIPFWNMYAGTHGVRLEHKETLLDLGIYYPIDNNVNKLLYPKLSTQGKEVSEQISINDGFRDWIYHPLSDSDKFLFYGIEYCDKEVVKSRKENIFMDEGINLQDIILLKTDYWEFQKEYRMVVQLNPKILSEDIKDAESYEELNDDEKIKFYFKEIMPRVANKMEYLDIQLSDDFFNDLEITLGPEANESEEIIVKSLLKEYAPNVKLNQSDLKGKIRSK